MVVNEARVVADVERKVSSLAFTLNTTGFAHLLRHDERFREARRLGVAAATELMADFANGRVHNSLSIVERLGFDPFGRVAQHKRYAAAAVGVAQFSLQVGIDLLATHLDQRAKRQAVTAYAAWLGFAHGRPPTARMLASIARQELDVGLTPSQTTLGSFESAVGVTIGNLARPGDRHVQFATLMDVAGAVDTSDSAVSARLGQLASLAGVRDGDIDAAVADFNENNEYESDVVGLAGNAVGVSFQDVFAHVSAAQSAAAATFDNDPYAASRAQRREAVKKGATTVAMAGLTFMTGGVGDFLLVAAAPVVHAAIGSPSDVRQMLNVSRALRSSLSRQSQDNHG